MTEDRLRNAEMFLQECVFRSRARQAAGVALGDPAGSRTTGTSRTETGKAPCGLGEGTIIELDLSERGEELFRTLWPRELAPTEVARIQDVMKRWVEQQDALDRKRNHFLRDFRQTNGFDRTAYTPEQANKFDAGLGRINAEVNARLREAAVELLGD